MLNHRRTLLVVVLLLATSMLACSISFGLGGETPAPEETALLPTQSPMSMLTVPSWPLVLSDDFDDPESGFSRDSDENRRYFYRDGHYGIEILKEDWSNWTWRGEIFSDFMLEADVTFQREGGQGGVIFRREGDHQFYHFTITSDGSYRLRKKTGRQVEDWAEIIDWTESPHITTGLATNRLGVVCEGSTISLYVNGQDLDSAQDTTYTEGKIGLTAGTFEGETHTLFHFDNLRVYATAPMVEATATLIPPATPTAVLQATATTIPPATATPTLPATATPAPEATATPPPPPAPSPTPGPIGSIAFAQEITEDLEPINPTTTFPAGTTRVYALFDYRGMRDGLVWGYVWLYEGEVDISWDDLWDKGQSGTSGVVLDNPGGLLPGTYRLTIWVQGQLVQSGSFVVQ